MNSAWADYWAKTRDRGVPAFLLRRGTMLGLIMFGLMIVVPRIFLMVENHKLPIVQFVVFMVLGYGLAYLLWLANERSYHKIRSEQAQRDSNDD